MRFGVLGTGVVGQAIATKLAGRGHEVRMGAREAHNAKAGAWAAKAGSKASHGTYAETAAFGEVVFHGAHGPAALEVLKAAGAENLRGKILIDVSNPLEFAPDGSPRLVTGSGESLAERIQAAFPQAKVVKTLNTVNTAVMVAPEKLQGEHDLFLAGNDAAARKRVADLLRDEFGWKSVVDLGDLTGARGMEAYLLFWLRLSRTFQTPELNIRVVR
jgi:hypothetical protein